jgi:hypothetical protein
MIVFLLLEDSEIHQHTQAIAAGKVRIGMHPRNLSPKTLKKDYAISIQPSLKIKHNDTSKISLLLRIAMYLSKEKIAV